MVKLTYSDAREFMHVVDSIAVLIEEAALSVTNEGVKLRSIDPSRTSMVDLVIPKDAFEEYPEGLTEEVRLGLNFNDLKKILRRAKRGDKISLEVQNGKVKIKLVGKTTRSVTLPVIETTSEQLPTPKVVFTVTAKISSDALKDAIKDADVVADSVRFEAKEDGLYIVASSDRGDLEVKFERESEVMFEYDLKEPAASRYSLDQLVDITSRAYKISDIVTVEFATAKPIALTFEIPMGGKLIYYIAPMLE